MGYLVGVEHFAGERVVPQGAGGAGAAVVQGLPAVLRLLLVLTLKVSRALEERQGAEQQGVRLTEWYGFAAVLLHEF